MRRRNAEPRRGGFTLIELLVAIGIIAILASLATGVFSRVRAVGQRTQVVAEVNDLAMACTKFKADFHFYPPSTFTIPDTVPTTAATDANAQGYRLLRRMFPRWNSTAMAGTGISILDGNGTELAGQALDANQALVFFLGGPAQTGWAPNAPAAPTGSTKKGPYYDFPVGRLDTSVTPPHYVDVWRTPIAYFASTASGYTGSFAVTAGTVQPFYVPGTMPVRYINQDGVQVISAGADRQFGPGADWTPAAGSYSGNAVGADDLANFNGGIALGVAP